MGSAFAKLGESVLIAESSVYAVGLVKNSFPVDTILHIEEGDQAR
jgi:hypothetical protein